MSDSGQLRFEPRLEGLSVAVEMPSEGEGEPPYVPFHELKRMSSWFEKRAICIEERARRGEKETCNDPLEARSSKARRSRLGLRQFLDLRATDGSFTVARKHLQKLSV